LLFSDSQIGLRHSEVRFGALKFFLMGVPFRTQLFHPIEATSLELVFRTRGFQASGICRRRLSSFGRRFEGCVLELGDKLAGLNAVPFFHHHAGHYSRLGRRQFSAAIRFREAVDL
jgi:hypothetical protein